MDSKVRALKLAAAIKDELPEILCDVRITYFATLPPLTVATVTIASMAYPLVETCHKTHEVLASEFRGENVSLQLIVR